VIRIRHIALPALALAVAAPAVAQDTTTVVRLRATYEVGNLSGFVVLPFGGGGDLADAAAESAEIVRRDLDFSDQFKLAAATGARAGDPVNVALWRERGADWVLTGTLAPRAGGSTLRLTLHDAVYGQTKGRGASTCRRPATAASAWPCTPPRTPWCAGPPASRGSPRRASPS
jgi:hypothetical protein